ncbi:MAG: hypothetical protein P8J37_23785 [Fuerstiella sp.]|nr:hypothetical protein [Fuerstiella sp.]
MNQDPVKVDRVEWLRLFPGLSLLQAARLGFRVRVLVPACFCLMVFAARQNVAEILWDFSPPPDRLRIAYRIEEPVFPVPVKAVVTGASRILASGILNNPWEFVSVIWSGLVLTVFGIAVSRSAATEYCIHSRTGVFSAMRFSFKHFTAGLVSTVLAASIVMAPLLVVSIAGWVMNFGSAGAWLVAICWPIVFLFGMLSIVVTIMCLIGWMLSLAAIGTDQCSGADALSRGINYVLSHKLLTALYLVTVIVVSSAAARIADWLIKAGTSVVSSRIENNHGTSPGILTDWMTAIQQVPHAVHLGVFLSGVTIMYVLLRQAEDGVHLREIDGAVTRTPKN